MFESIEDHGVRMPDGSFERADAILWATGFRAEIRHLATLGIRTAEGGIRVDRGRSLDEPRLFVIGYGASQSTIGANRAGRDAVRAILADPLFADPSFADPLFADPSFASRARAIPPLREASGH